MSLKLCFARRSRPTAGCPAVLEFSYNGTPHTVTGQSPFFLTYGMEPRSFDLTSSASATALDDLPAFLHAATTALSAGQERQKLYYDRGRRAINFAKDDFVLLDRSGIHQSDLPVSLKFQSRFLGPYRVLSTDIPRDNYTLELPHSFHRLHNVFHVSLLKPYIDPTSVPVPRSVTRPQADAHDEFEVDRILGQRIRYNKPQYLVHWKGYDTSEATWEPASALTNCSTALAAFRKTKTQ